MVGVFCLVYRAVREVVASSYGLVDCPTQLIYISIVKSEKKIAGKSAMCSCVLTCFVFLIFVFVFTTKYHLVFCAVKQIAAFY